MSFIVDTNVVSELRKRERANAGVRRWMQAHPISDLYLSVVTLSELETGFLGMKRKDPTQAAALRSWLDTVVLPQFAARILIVDEAVALRCAPLHVPNKRSYADSLIAATALAHGFAVVTRNVDDFLGMSVPLINPWNA